MEAAHLIQVDQAEDDDVEHVAPKTRAQLSCLSARTMRAHSGKAACGLMLLALVAVMGKQHLHPVTGHAEESVQLAWAPVNPAVAPNAQEHPQQEHPCSNYPYLKFLTIAQNNLGDQGPGKGKEGIIYRTEDMSTNKLVDVHVHSKSEKYTAFSNKYNGMEGKYGRINLKEGSDVNLELSLFDTRSGLPIKVDAVALTFLDLDSGAAGGQGAESVTVTGFDMSTRTQSTQVREIKHQVLGSPNTLRSTFSSTVYGDANDNPEDPIWMTQEQKDRAVTLIFSDVHAINVTLTAGAIEQAAGPRLFHFVFRPTLLCAVTVQEKYREEPRLLPLTMSPGEEPVIVKKGSIFMRWYANKGSFIHKGDLIAEVKTSYGNVSALEAPVDGIIGEVQMELKDGDKIEERLQDGDLTVAVIGKILPLPVNLMIGEAPVNARPDVRFAKWLKEKGDFVDAGDPVAELFGVDSRPTGPLLAPRAGIIVMRQELLRPGMLIEKVMMDYDLAVLGTFPALKVGVGEGPANAAPSMVFKKWLKEVGDTVERGEAVAQVVDEDGVEQEVLASKYGTIQERQPYLRKGHRIDEVMADRNLVVIGKHPELVGAFREVTIDIEQSQFDAGAIFLDYLVKEGDQVGLNQSVARLVLKRNPSVSVAPGSVEPWIQPLGGRRLQDILNHLDPEDVETIEVKSTAWGTVTQLAHLHRGQTIKDEQGTPTIAVLSLGAPWWIALVAVLCVLGCCVGGLFAAMSKRQTSYAPMVDLPKRENTPPIMEAEPLKPPLPAQMPPLPPPPSEPPRPPPPPGTRLEFVETTTQIKKIVYARYRPLGIKNVVEAPIMIRPEIKEEGTGKVIRPGCFSLNSYLKLGLGLDETKEWKLTRIGDTELMDRRDFGEVNGLLSKGLSKWPMWPLPLGFKDDSGNEFKRMFVEQRLGMLYSRGKVGPDASDQPAASTRGDPAISPIKVTGVRPGSPAAKEGVMEGWYIVQVGDRIVDRFNPEHDFKMVMSWLTEGVVPLDWPMCELGDACTRADCLYRHNRDNVAPSLTQGTLALQTTP